MLKGKAHKFGDSISTDHIIPGRYAHLRSNLPELAKHVLEDADVNFAKKVQQGDFGWAVITSGWVPAGAPPLVIKMAASRISWPRRGELFYRNAITWA
jgi:3-isopropylmalate/(R)-2-methylmalate dehydratase small subunit